MTSVPGTTALATSAVLDTQYASAERLMNFVRMGVLATLGVAGAFYAPHLTYALNVVNLSLLLPMFSWALWQHFAVHRRGRVFPMFSLVNALVDISAVTALLILYGLVGAPDLAVKSPVFVTYFAILAARPFTGSSRWALMTGLVAALQYSLIVLFFTRTGRLELLDTPMMAVAQSGTSFVDEMSKVLLIIVAGAAAAYATAWNVRTLTETVTSMRDSETRFRSVFEQASVGIAVLDQELRIVETNSAFASLVGANPAELRGCHPQHLSPPEDAEATSRLLAAANESGESGVTEVRYVRKDGRITWGNLSLSPVRFGSDQHMIAMVQDVTARKTLEAELLHQAFHDPLTGLSNRALFRDRVEHALARNDRERAKVGAIFLDLDNFKSVNDTLGHAAGDRLLAAVALRLLHATRGCDTVARLGGDEFGVLLENVTTDEDAEIVAERIAASLRAPLQIDPTHIVDVTASIGIARAEPGIDTDALLRNADLAMYGAKARGRGAYLMFDRGMHAALVDRVTMESDLVHAVERNQLRLLYQPIVDLRTEYVVGVETLARWDHPTRGLVSPERFVPVAEENGAIRAIGRWVLNQACAQGVRWNDNALRRLYVTVNVSGRQLADEEFASIVSGALHNSGLRPDLLVLEITESVIMQDTQATLERLRELKALGVRIAVDDFGTGYSSLSHLQRFPVDMLKIDRSFVAGVPHNHDSVALARTIIALGGMLSLQAVAEGIERPEQQQRLQELGCALGQGYLFSVPVSAEEVSALLEPSRFARAAATRVAPERSLTAAHGER